MPAIRLKSTLVPKLWGRSRLPPMFDQGDIDGPVGEIWFGSGEGPDEDLLVKFLFTSKRLSIQVQPDDDSARAAGFARGKAEAWLVLDAEQDGEIGLGLVKSVSKAELMACALDGRIENLLDWRSVRHGDCYYLPPGTIHAIGPGLVLLEIQQNSDVTYRLYDYGRDRDLHLDQAVQVSKPEPFKSQPVLPRLVGGRTVITAGSAFSVERWSEIPRGMISSQQPIWIIPLTGSGTLGNQTLSPGGVWLARGQTAIALNKDAEVIAAYAGSVIEGTLIV